MDFWPNWTSSTKQEIAEVHLKYDAYVRAHGELFEDAWVQMTPEEAENTVTRKKKFLKTWWILFVIMMLAVSTGLFLGGAPQDGDWLYVAMFPITGLLFLGIRLNQYNQALASNEMHVIRGVITRKQMFSKLFKNTGEKLRDGKHVEFSKRLMVRIGEADYKVIELGDIIRMEILADDITMKRRVVKEGKI